MYTKYGSKGLIKTKYRMLFFIAFIGKWVYGPPDGKWLPSRMNVSNVRDTVKSLLTTAYQVSCE